MNVIELALFLFFPCCWVLCAHYLFSGIGGLGQIAGCVLGGVVGVILWVVACDFLMRKHKKHRENAVLPHLRLLGAIFKDKPTDELNALPADTEEMTLWNDVPVQFQTQCKKLEDGKFQLTLSVKFQEEAGDTITYTREFVAPNQQEKQT